MGSPSRSCPSSTSVAAVGTMCKSYANQGRCCTAPLTGLCGLLLFPRPPSQGCVVVAWCHPLMHHHASTQSATRMRYATITRRHHATYFKIKLRHRPLPCSLPTQGSVTPAVLRQCDNQCVPREGCGRSKCCTAPMTAAVPSAHPCMCCFAYGVRTLLHVPV